MLIIGGGQSLLIHSAPVPMFVRCHPNRWGNRPAILWIAEDFGCCASGWRNPAGKSVIESYTIPAMAHGTALATGPSDEHVGVPGAFLLDVGISSSYHIAKFWGLTTHPRAVPIRRNESASIVPAPPRQYRATAETSGAAGDLVGNAPEPMRPHTRLIDVQAVITHALKAAGLMKS
jgi:hypothetical protein